MCMGRSRSTCMEASERGNNAWQEDTDGRQRDRCVCERLDQSSQRANEREGQSVGNGDMQPFACGMQPESSKHKMQRQAPGVRKIS
jgi:hypothetical protein